MSTWPVLAWLCGLSAPSHCAAMVNSVVFAGKAGELVAAEALAPPSEGKWAGEAAIATDGPFAEVKEHLAGFFLVDCAGFERALEIAGRVPEAALGLVEVRPVIDSSALLT